MAKEAPEGKGTRPPSVANAVAFQKRSAEAFSGQRKRETDDLKCQIPSGLWPADVVTARKGSNVGGINIPARPMLSIPKLDQPVQIQMNQMRAAHLGVHIRPLNQQANKETAEIKQGLYRSIEVDSHADQGRLWGADRALKCGTGWYRVNVVYDDTTDDPFDLTIRIERILRQGSCFPDPFAQQPDFSDGKEFLYVSFLSLATFKETYKQSKICQFEGDELKAWMDDAPFWFEGDSENPAICVAEYFYTEYRDREWVIADDGAFVFADEVPAGRTISKDTKRRKVKEPVIKWAKVTACDELESETWNGKYIPFIPCIGRELQTFDGERRWFGLYSTNKDSAHLFNVAVSNAVEVSALEPKAPWIGAVGQFKTNNKQWQLANVRNLPYLEYDPVTVGGNLAPPPQRNLGGSNLGPSIALIEIADNNLQAGTAMYEPTLGKSERDDPAKKVLALQDQGLVSNSHWLANLAEISMPYEAKVVLDLMPKVFDRPGRSCYVTGEDGEQTEVILNHPFVTDPKTQRPVMVEGWQEGDPVPEGAKFYNLTEGKYGCVVTVGKRFETRAREGADAFSQLLMAQPELIKVLGDIWMGFQDFPGHELAAKRLKAAIPPGIKQADNEEGQPDAQALQAELQMAEQGAQMMKAIIEEQGKAIETDAIKAQAKLREVQESNRAKVDIEALKLQHAETMLRLKQDFDLRMKLLELGHADLEREDEQAHEAAMAGAAAAEANAAAERAEAHDVDMAERGHLGTLDEGEASHAHSMESQTQAESAAAKQAAMKPKPNGASA